MKCKICRSKSKVTFQKKILGKYLGNYFQCGTCDFIWVDNPHWLSEAYKDYEKNHSPQTADWLPVNRALQYAPQISTVIEKHFNPKGKFLDYGGGYGLLVRLMRDRGYNFYLQDEYNKSLFANGVVLSDLGSQKFEMITAIDVFEHLPDPMEVIEKLLTLTDSLYIGTLLQPKDLTNWWYFDAESGQHISFFSQKSMEYIARKFNLKLYSKWRGVHILTSKKLSKPLHQSLSLRARTKLAKMLKPEIHIPV